GHKSHDVVNAIPDGGAIGAIQTVFVQDDPSLQFGTGDFAIAMVLNAQQLTEPTKLWQKNWFTISVDPNQNLNVATYTAAAHAHMALGTWHVVLIRGPALEVRIDGMATTGTTSTDDLSAP